MALITLDPGNKDMKEIIGKGLLVLLLGAIAYGFYTIRKEIISFTEDTLYLGLMIAGICLVSLWLSSGGARAIKYLVYGFGQASLGWAIEMNPFNILDYKIRMTELAANEHLKHQDILIGQHATQKEKIDEAETEMKHAFETKKTLEKIINKGTATENEIDNYELCLQTITTNQEYINGMQQSYNDLEKLIFHSQRAHRTAILELNKAKKDLKMKRDLWETVTTASNMMKRAMTTLLGNDKINADADKAIDSLKKDIGQKIGAIRTGIKITSQYMDGKDLANASKLKTTLQKLEGIDLSKQTYGSTVEGTRIGNIENKSGSNRYLDYLGKKDS